MLRFLAIAILVLFCASPFFAAEDVVVTAGSSAKKIKVLILPFSNLTDKAKYKNSQIMQSIYFKSLYSFIGIIPSLDVPDASVLTNQANLSAPIETLASNLGADMVIYGNYHFDGQKLNPYVVCQLKIWDNTKKTNFVNTEYKSSTGADIFDTIDLIVARTLKSTLNIEPDTATINFADFKVGKEQYDLLVNNKQIDTISNSSYSFSLKILPDSDYHVALRRKTDNQEAFKALIKLQKYQTIEIGYTAYGTVRINPIAYKDRRKTYTVLFDDKPVREGELLTNVFAGITHTMVLKDNQSNEIDRDSFYLKDSENKTVSPHEKDYSPWHVKLFTLDHSFGTIGGEYFFDRYLWAGLGVGVSYFSASSGSLVFLSPYIEGGYYILGDSSQDFRAGAGLVGRLNIYQPEDVAKKINPDARNFSPDAGIFLQIEWKFIMFRPAAYIYMANGAINFSYGLGAGIRF